jgi:hypothetical protein
MARRKGIPEKFTAELRAAFLSALAEHGFVTRAARSAGINRDTARKARKNDPAFAAAWAEAMAEYVENLEAEADRRAYRGTARPVFYQGEKCGEIQEYSDTLLIFRLKALKPDVYADRSKHELAGKDGGPIQFENMTEEQVENRIADLLRKAGIGATA